MSAGEPKCLVNMLLQYMFKDDIPQDYYLSTISRCKCSEHINEMPVALPSLKDYHDDLAKVMMDLLNWAIDNKQDDTTGNCIKLIQWIQEKFLGTGPDSISPVLDVLLAKFDS